MNQGMPPVVFRDALYGIIEDTCKQVVSYYDTYRIVYGEEPNPNEAQLVEHFLIALVGSASSRMGISSWRDYIQLVSGPNAQHLHLYD